MIPINPYGRRREDVSPEDTLAMRARKSSKVRETAGAGTGASVATLAVWLASKAGIDLPPEIAVTIGGIVTSVVSALIRKAMSRI